MYALSEVYRRRGTLNPGQGKELPHIMSHLFQVSRIKPHVLNWIQVYLQHFNFYTVKPRFTGSPMNESCDMMWYRQTGTMKLHDLVLFFCIVLNAAFSGFEKGFNEGFLRWWILIKNFKHFRGCKFRLYWFKLILLNRDMQFICTCWYNTY